MAPTGPNWLDRPDHGETWNSATVPTDLERAGDFSRSLDPSGALLIIYDPRTTRPDPAAPAGVTRYIRDAFPGNVIPSGLVSPIAAAILKYYPAPNQAGNGRSNTNNFFTAATNSIDSDRVDVRVDHQISSKHLLFGHYNWFRNLNAQPLVFGNFASPVQTPNRIPGINETINHTWTVGPTTVNPLNSWHVPSPFTTLTTYVPGGRVGGRVALRTLPLTKVVCNPP